MPLQFSVEAGCTKKLTHKTIYKQYLLVNVSISKYGILSIFVIAKVYVEQTCRPHLTLNSLLPQFHYISEGPLGIYSPL